MKWTIFFFFLNILAVLLTIIMKAGFGVTLAIDTLDYDAGTGVFIAYVYLPYVIILVWLEGACPIKNLLNGCPLPNLDLNLIPIFITFGGLLFLLFEMLTFLRKKFLIVDSE